VHGRVLNGPSRTLAAGLAVVIAGVLPGFFTASLAPRMDADFALDDSTLGTALALFYVSSALGSPPAGRLVQRMGATLALRLSAGMAALSCTGIAALVDSAGALIAMLVVGGLANALSAPAGSALIREHIHARRQGLAYGMQQAGAPVGALLAGLALPFAAVPFGWRWAFAFAGVAALVAAAAAPRRSVGDRRTTAEDEAGAGRWTRRAVADYLLAVATALGTAASVGLLAFLVVYSVRSGFEESAAGVLLASVSLASGASRISLGHLVDRRAGEPLPVTAALLAVAALGYLLLTTAEPGLIAIGALVSGGIGWGWAGLMSHAVVERQPEAPAPAMATMMTGLFAGAIAGPVVVGFLAADGSFRAAWLACAAMSLLAAATVVLATRSAGRSC
jgi:MFS family permease